MGDAVVTIRAFSLGIISLKEGRRGKSCLVGEKGKKKRDKKEGEKRERWAPSSPTTLIFELSDMVGRGRLYRGREKGKRLQ